MMKFSLFKYVLEAKTVINEPPNFVTLIYRVFKHKPIADFLHNYENIIFSVLAALIISFIFQWGIRKREMIPNGLQNFLEMVLENINKGVMGILGPSGKTYVPFIGTLFLYILVMNLMGLVPLMKAPSSNLNVTLALAICVFCYVQFLNIKHMGFFGFIYHMMGSPKDWLGWLLVPIMLPLEIISQLSRPITLALRLFGNIMGEEALVAYFALAGVFLISYYQIPIGIPFQLPFVLFGLLTSLMQALVFSLLTTIYILLSLPDESHVH